MKKQILLLCMITASVFTTFADKTIYVAPAVKGTGDGTSADNACTFTNVLGRTTPTPVLTPTIPLDATGITTIILPTGGSFTEKEGKTTSGRIIFPDNSKIILEGNNSTLFGLTTDTRIMRINAGTNITLKNITFKNGAHLAAPGAAIFFLGDSLKISNCSFDNNTSQDGGAIASRGKYVKISNSYFANNKLTGAASAGPTNGAAIVHTGTATGGTLIVENTTFYNNTGATGSICRGTAICTAYDNYTNGVGTRGYLNTIDITNCTFVANKSASNLTSGNATVYLDELATGTNSTTATFVNNTFYGNSNCGIYVAGIKQTVKLINNVIVGDSYSTVSVAGVFDNGVITGSTIANGRPAIIAFNNYIVTKNPISTSISEASFQTGTNGNIFVTTASQSDIDFLNLSTTLETSGSPVPYLSTLSSSSPLVEGGINAVSGITMLSTDTRGILRAITAEKTGTKYDIGAYENNNLPTALKGISNDSFLFNQSANEITISSNNKTLVVNVFLVNGQSVYTKTTSSTITINKTQLPKGVLIFIVNDGEKSVAKKIIN